MIKGAKGASDRDDVSSLYGNGQSTFEERFLANIPRNPRDPFSQISHKFLSLCSLCPQCLKGRRDKQMCGSDGNVLVGF